MAESPSTKSVPADINTKSDDSNQLNQSDRRACHSSPTKSTNTAEATGNGIGNKAKSCKGCLYYSSRFKDDSRNPLCVGLTRSLPNVPPYIVGQSEVEASKEGRNLVEFRYACVGYSLYKDHKGQAPSGQQPQAELPVCLGLEVLVDRRVNPSAEAAPNPAHVHNKGDGNDLPQRRTPKPTNAIGEEFTRNANLVANGVAKNICKDPTFYRQLIGVFDLFGCHSADIANVVHIVSQFMCAPRTTHHSAVLHIILYVKGTLLHDFHFSARSSLALSDYSNEGWAGDHTDHHSTTEFCFFLGDSLISWRNKKQTLVSRLNVNSEYRALVDSTSDVLWLGQLLDHLGAPWSSSTSLHCDSHSAIKISHYDLFMGAPSIEINCHFIQ
ncbi:Unknown protein [Striga hermonthica]|uniref:DUF8204 domain-containing protein n=1 Tax=Striga hermonthica TaxID=68872 RepID=A0A9N7NVR1_STRHE|nr:Unknown protein [Striga hermonthica]